MQEQVALTLVAVAAVVVGAVLNNIAHTKAGKALAERLAAAEKRAAEAEAQVRAWYDAHTTPGERALVNEAVQAGIAGLKAEFPALAARVAAVEQEVARLGAPTTTATAATPQEVTASTTPAATTATGA